MCVHTQTYVFDQALHITYMKLRNVLDVFIPAVHIPTLADTVQ